ncbi:MAG: hypothetical protein EBR82_35205 [Caulobacteraceae bacterium]|nr:hypothetical protein [Caulobacteraceae bacterium]
MQPLDGAPFVLRDGYQRHQALLGVRRPRPGGLQSQQAAHSFFGQKQVLGASDVSLTRARTRGRARSPPILFSSLLFCAKRVERNLADIRASIFASMLGRMLGGILGSIRASWEQLAFSIPATRGAEFATLDFAEPFRVAITEAVGAIAVVRLIDPADIQEGRRQRVRRNGEALAAGGHVLRVTTEQIGLPMLAMAPHVEQQQHSVPQGNLQTAG